MQPLVFEPYLRPQIWGDRRLESFLGKMLPNEGRYGESWELSGHPLHVSRVESGPFRGESLQHLWDHERVSLTGTQIVNEARFPWLLKFLDCHEQLSVQVHPGDAGARRMFGDELGKTEAWVVLDAAPGATIGAGLQAGVTRTDLEQHLKRGDVAECLNTFHPRPGDCLYLPAGTVHTAGGGVLIWEIQRCSDATLRLFDWNRPGLDGRPRALRPLEALRLHRLVAGARVAAATL